MKVASSFLIAASLLLVPLFSLTAQVPDKEQESLIKPEVEISSNIFWQVKAYHPDAKLLKVKAFDGKGNICIIWKTGGIIFVRNGSLIPKLGYWTRNCKHKIQLLSNNPKIFSFFQGFSCRQSKTNDPIPI